MAAESSRWGRLPGGWTAASTRQPRQCVQISQSLFWFLAVIQIMNKNQLHKTKSHPLLLLPAPPCGGHRSGTGGREWLMPQAGNENWPRGGNLKRNKLKAIPSSQGSVLSPPALQGAVSTVLAGCLLPLVWLEGYSRAAGGWVGPGPGPQKKCTTGTGEAEM